MSSVDLFSPFRLGPLDLPNRVVMAPMTRNRAGPGNVPTALNATYYAQRAGAGLIVSEATQVSPQGVGYPGTPGIHSAEQVAGWKLVTDAVHDAGGRIFLQLWHVGRISHPSMQPGGALPVAPSAIAPAGQAWTLDGMKLTSRRARWNRRNSRYRRAIPPRRGKRQSRRLRRRRGARRQRLSDRSVSARQHQQAHRRYGGSATNRARLIVEVMEAVVSEWGGERVGVRLSPTNLAFNDIADSDPARDIFDRGPRARPPRPRLSAHGGAGAGRSGRRPAKCLDAAFFRQMWRGALVANKAYDLARANAMLRAAPPISSRSPTLYHRQSRSARALAPRRRLQSRRSERRFTAAVRRLHGLSGAVTLAIHVGSITPLSPPPCGEGGVGVVTVT